jgi:hypothetical protein
VILALCATCRKAIFSWETPSLIDGLPSEILWTHYVRDDEHFAVPSESIRERFLYCASCRRRQVLGPAGWYCANIRCPSRVDNGGQ